MFAALRLAASRACSTSGINGSVRKLERFFVRFLETSVIFPSTLKRSKVWDSLRHSSTTYKLKLNHGDLKATQGDTGHAEIDMITSVYAHILDEDRKINAQKFESAFYANPNLREVHPPEEPREQAPATLDLEALVEQLRQSPELANTLAALLSAAPGGR